MRVHEALSQLDVIHDHLSRAETYRGFRAGGVALTGCLGLLAAALETTFVSPEESVRFVWYWIIVAAICALPAGGTAFYLRLFCERGLAGRRSDRVAFQFLPCVAAGALVTSAFVRAGPDLIVFLPGLWTILFSLGHLAMRPYLPSAVAAVGLFYLVAGAWLLGAARGELLFQGWMVGLVFGVGHLATALILHLNREDRNHV